MNIATLLTILTMLVSMANSPDLDSAQRQQALNMANSIREYVIQYAVSMEEDTKKPQNDSVEREESSSADVEQPEENAVPEPKTEETVPSEPKPQPLTELQKKRYERRERATMTPNFVKP